MNSLKSLIAFLRYNANHIFAGKFIYFLLSALALFFGIIIINLLGDGGTPDPQRIYNYLLVPGILLVFYPSVYSIQRDSDTRMIETLFGIPDYRYKVWLVRLFTLYMIIAFILFILALLCQLGLSDFPVGKMLFHLIIPVMFIGCLAFMLSTLTRSGNSAAVLMVVFILFFWITSEPLVSSSWFLFHNPFQNVSEIQTLLWSETTFYNRLYLIIGAVISLLFGLLRLQKREKFI